MDISDQYGNKQSFDDWYSRYYGGGYRSSNNDQNYGYGSQNRLSDLVNQPRNFTYTNQNFSAPQQYYQQSYQPQQQTYQPQTQQQYQPQTEIRYFTRYNGELIPMSDYVRMENARVRGVSSYDY